MKTFHVFAFFAQTTLGALQVALGNYGWAAFAFAFAAFAVYCYHIAE